MQLLCHIFFYTEHSTALIQSYPTPHPVFPFNNSGTLTHRHTDILSHIILIGIHAQSATCWKLHTASYSPWRHCVVGFVTIYLYIYMCLDAALLLTSYMHRPMNGGWITALLLCTQHSNIKYMNLGSLYRGATLHALRHNCNSRCCMVPAE